MMYTDYVLTIYMFSFNMYICINKVSTNVILLQLINNKVTLYPHFLNI